MKGLFLTVSIIGLVVIGIATNMPDTPAAVTKAAAKPKPSPEALGFAGFLIRSQGFVCPEAKLIFPKGLSAQGPVLKVHCGPAGSDGVYSAFAYRLTDRDSKGWLAEEWQ